MAYTQSDLVKNLIEFNDEYGRYPTHKDFEEGLIKPSRNVFYRQFGDMNKAIEKAELFRSGKLKNVEPEYRKIKCRDQRAQCSFCGNPVNDPNKHYDTIQVIIMSRFLENYKQSHSEEYRTAIFDCCISIFNGKNNQYLRKELEKRGLLEKFDLRLDERGMN